MCSSDLSLRPDGREGQADALLLALQNLGPCRRGWSLPAGWRLLERVDGLGRPLPSSLSLGPWQLGFWRVTPAVQPLGR